MRRLLVAFLGVLLTCGVQAGDVVGDYFASLETFEADFSQHVVDASGGNIQDSEGRVWIARPGRFRWDYESPFRQQLIANGKQLWTYDEDLEQATVQPVDEALSSTPAMLLSGYRPLGEVMQWRGIGKEGGLDWYQLTPKQNDTSVERIRIAFQSGELRVIEVVDGFGNNTRIRFTGIKRNQALDENRFVFTPPAGTDVIGNGG